ncbi:putative sialic acid transporter [Streptococcus mitis]|uniref:Putative sialic acid transporter n=1 Tax=Streptococcus mitis TaxID=28037 RepID=A0A150NMS7_STRMT|nr:putative sialic acid transporter [Streptococcus mitis]
MVLSGLLLLLTVYYLARGGLWVVLWTDFFQGLVLLAILALFLPRIAQSGLVVNSSQQLSHFAETLDGKMVFILVAGAGFSSLFSYVSSQDIVQRFNSKIGVRRLENLMATGTLVLWDC